MKIAIIGAGAMGCRFGAMFHQAGQEVVLVDGWKKHVEQIQKYGLQVIQENTATVIPIQATTSATDRGVVDLVVVFTKAMHTAQAVKDAKPLIGEHTMVMTLQNGLGHVETIAEVVPLNRIIAGVTNFGTELVGPGVIRALGSGETSIMSADGSKTEQLETICRVMNEAGMNVVITPQVFVSIWQKVAFNAVFNPLSALTRLKVADIGLYEGLGDIMFGILDEAVAVAACEGIDLNRDEIAATIYRVLDPAMSGEHLPSMLQDVLNKRQTEIEYINGAIAKRAKTYGLAAPYNTLLYHLVRMVETTYERRIEVVHS